MSLIGAESATTDDPDTYSIEALSQPQQASLVRAFNSEGKLLWSAQDGGGAEAVASTHTDPQASLVRLIQRSQTGPTVSSLNKRDAHTGQETWRYTSPLGVAAFYQNQAIDSLGTVYMLEEADPDCNTSKNATVQIGDCTYTRVVALDGQTGRPKFSVDFPKNHIVFYNYCHDPNYSMADTAEDWYKSPGNVSTLPFHDTVGSITIGPDNTVYVPFVYLQTQQHSDCTSASANDDISLALLVIKPNGSSSWSKLVSFPWVFPSTPLVPPITLVSPVSAIPTNTAGEVLVNWIETDNAFGCGPCNSYTKITRVSPSGSNTYNTPSVYQTQMVVGENNTAYGLGELGVSAFDLATGTPAWTASSSDNLSVATATGVSTVSNAGITVYDQSGVPTSYNLGVQQPLYRSFGKWIESLPLLRTQCLDDSFS